MEQVMARQASEDLLVERPGETAAASAAAIADAATARMLVCSPSCGALCTGAS